MAGKYEPLYGLLDALARDYPGDRRITDVRRSVETMHADLKSGLKWRDDEAKAQGAARDRSDAAVQRVLDLADRMERESPKPGAGGFLAEEIRAVAKGER